ncbi:MAG TPA: tail fiber domain-containing protein [Polyangiaceae bacterium]|nr:tail fiber domain-containing protein [Polyangiaceae bacterium]
MRMLRPVPLSIVSAVVIAGCSSGAFSVGQVPYDGGLDSSSSVDTGGGGGIDSGSGGTDSGGGADSGGGGIDAAPGADSPGGGTCGATTCGTGQICCPGPCGSASRCENGSVCTPFGITCAIDAGTPADGGGACKTNADCPNGGVCGFPEASGCAAVGACFPSPGVICNAFSPGCACDGTEVSVVCTGLPNGYVSKPLLHTGACASVDAGSPTRWFLTCGDPVCRAPTSDGGVRDDAGAPCPPVGSPCSVDGERCGTSDPTVACGATEECASQDPAVMCPKSSRRFKDGIEYVGDSRLAELHDEALRIRLATYHYKPQVADPNPRHLGFIIEDNPASPAVAPGQEHVDLYGYVSMAIAAMQVQEREIAELREELDRARAGVCAPPTTPSAASK